MNPTSKQKSFRAFGALFLHFHVQGPPAPPQNYKLPPPPLLSPSSPPFTPFLALQVQKN